MKSSTLPKGTPIVLDEEEGVAHLAYVKLRGNFGERPGGKLDPYVVPNEVDGNGWPEVWRTGCMLRREDIDGRQSLVTGVLIRSTKSHRLPMCSRCAKLLDIEQMRVLYTLMARMSVLANDVQSDIDGIRKEFERRDKGVTVEQGS